MKDIKFRAWDKLLCEMFDVYTLSKYDAYAIQNNTEDMYELALKDCEIMQYTGLKDKNGVEIYEGDIVKLVFPYGHSNDCVSVDYDSEVVTKVTFDYQGVYFVEKDCTWYYSCGLISDDVIFKVIGNIYENPELL